MAKEEKSKQTKAEKELDEIFEVLKSVSEGLESTEKTPRPICGHKNCEDCPLQATCNGPIDWYMMTLGYCRGAHTRSPRNRSLPPTRRGGQSVKTAAVSRPVPTQCLPARLHFCPYFISFIPEHRMVDNYIVHL